MCSLLLSPSLFHDGQQGLLSFSNEPFTAGATKYIHYRRHGADQWKMSIQLYMCCSSFSLAPPHVETESEWSHGGLERQIGAGPVNTGIGESRSQKKHSDASPLPISPNKSGQTTGGASGKECSSGEPEILNNTIIILKISIFVCIGMLIPMLRGRRRLRVACDIQGPSLN